MSERLADDLIVGTARIGEEIGRTRRQTQHLIDTGEIPAFKLGGEVGLSIRSTLRKRFEQLGRLRRIRAVRGRSRCR